MLRVYTSWIVTTMAHDKPFDLLQFEPVRFAICDPMRVPSPDSGNPNEPVTVGTSVPLPLLASIVRK